MKLNEKGGERLPKIIVKLKKEKGDFRETWKRGAINEIPHWKLNGKDGNVVDTKQ